MTTARIVPNALASLRQLCVWLEDGHLYTRDCAIVAWVVDPELRVPVPVGVGHIEGSVIFVHDQTQKTWTSPEGHVYENWQDVVKPFYSKWDREHPRIRSDAVDWPLDQKHPSPPLTTPSIGAPPRPQPWKAGKS
jgi:hypothetical protein